MFFIAQILLYDMYCVNCIIVYFYILCVLYCVYVTLLIVYVCVIGCIVAPVVSCVIYVVCVCRVMYTIL